MFTIHCLAPLRDAKGDKHVSVIQFDPSSSFLEYAPGVRVQARKYYNHQWDTVHGARFKSALHGQPQAFQGSNDVKIVKGVVVPTICNDVDHSVT
jgi:hypothetical protein